MDNPGGHKQLPWLGMANIAPIKMAMECGLFVALGFPHYSCGKIGFVWIIHPHSTDVVLSYSSRKSTINHEYTWVSMYKHIKYIYIRSYLQDVSQDFKIWNGFFVIICHSKNNKVVLSWSGKTMENMACFFNSLKR